MIDLYIVILAVGVAAIIGILGYVRTISNDLNDLYWLLDDWNDQIEASIEDDRKAAEEGYNKSEKQLTGYQ